MLRPTRLLDALTKKRDQAFESYKRLDQVIRILKRELAPVTNGHDAPPAPPVREAAPPEDKRRKENWTKAKRAAFSKAMKARWKDPAMRAKLTKGLKAARKQQKTAAEA